MKLCFLVGLLSVFVGIGSAQSECREAAASVVQQDQNFTTYSVSLPTHTGTIRAEAFLPNNRGHVLQGVVFSLSRLASSVTDESVAVLPVAKDVATQGRAAIVVDRTLTWPKIGESVGKMQAVVLCAEQWLSAHAAIRPDNWYFVGPLSDRPTFDQLKALGDTHSMTFMWSVSIADAPDWKFTEEALHGGSTFLIQDTRSFFEGTVEGRASR